MIKQLLTKDYTNSEEFIFSLPAFALMGKYKVFMNTVNINPVNNWNLRQHSIPTAYTHCSHPDEKSGREQYCLPSLCRYGGIRIALLGNCGIGQHFIPISHANCTD
ncbi:MAG TPA: hypothetical protein VJY41_11525 [Prolixibacteraceae bacterium]|nr:hypothetical protein [Prolixibacteraceae bacterium]